MPITIKTNGMAFKDADGTYKQFDAIKSEGSPAGGTTGQVLAKKSNEDYDVEWKSVDIEDVVYSGDGTPTETVGVDADRLGGHTYEDITNGMLKQNLDGYLQGTPTLTNADLLGGVSRENLGINMDLLWENPNPTSAFGEQTISIQRNGYSLLVLLTREESSDDIHTFVPILNVVGYRAESSTAVWHGGYLSQRLFRVSDGGIVFSSGYKGGGSTVDNTCAIPYRIYGIK